MVVVELTAVKFWRVVEPVTRRLPRVARPELLIRVLMIFVIVPLVAKKLVVVALVPVALRKVRF